ncbi:MAG: hypothetical protein CMJ19_06625 [Phycisphaeraceae bacterium]|nr:hypothetical protein [Phycisphaeraceae bacterium]|tara:strand:+ start:23229 stop:24056 length:828 start_codon:yes stop_codon:yes gene_type:complete
MEREQHLVDTLDACLDQVRGGQTIDDALAEHPADAEALRPLLDIATRLECLPDPNVSLAGLMKTLGRLGSQTLTASRAEPAPRKVRWFSRPVWTRAAAIVLVMFLIGWGTVNASAGAMPGDFLYPVKLFTERARFFLTLNTEDQAELRIVFSSRRLREAVAQQQRTGQADPQILDQMLEEARLAVLAAPQLSEPNRQLLVSRAAYLTDYQRDALDRFTSTGHPQEQVIARYRDMCWERGRWMRQMLAPGEDAAPSNQQPQAQPNWRRWCDDCPMW